MSDKRELSPFDLDYLRRLGWTFTPLDPLHGMGRSDEVHCDRCGEPVDDEHACQQCGRCGSCCDCEEE